jgi:hypothetical protein
MPAKSADLGKPWRDAFTAEYTASLAERLSAMTEAQKFEFMRWFVGDAEARQLTRKLSNASPR